MTAPTAAVATHRDGQRGGPPPERLVRQPTDHGIPRDALAAAPVAPVVRFDDPARQHRPAGLDELADDLQAEFESPQLSCRSYAGCGSRLIAA